MRTSKASRWLGRVKACPCVLCDAPGRSQQYPTDAHHMCHGQGMAQRSSDFADGGAVQRIATEGGYGDSRRPHRCLESPSSKRSIWWP